MGDPSQQSPVKECLLEIVQEGNALHLIFKGVFTRQVRRPTIEEIVVAIESVGSTTLGINANEVLTWDSSFLAFLIKIRTYCLDNSIQIKTVQLQPGVERLLRLATSVPEVKDTRSKATARSFFYVVGDQFLSFCRTVTEILSFFGQIVVSSIQFLRGASGFRWRDTLLFIDECGPSALPIVTLISLLVGLILAYIGATQLQKFGAELYAANLVGVAMAREMGAIMAAVIMSGRTGAAFAAQLGTMQVNEEIDALETFGFQSVSFLVIPRMIALILMLPLLTIYADVMGVVGGAVVIVSTFDISFAQYFNQTWESVHINDIFAGLIKSVVFAVLVAICGCLYGIQCGRSAAAVGVAVTSAVVSGIVCIVVADAIFAVMFTTIGL